MHDVQVPAWRAFFSGVGDLQTWCPVVKEKVCPSVCVDMVVAVRGTVCFGGRDGGAAGTEKQQGCPREEMSGGSGRGQHSQQPTAASLSAQGR